MLLFRAQVAGHLSDYFVMVATISSTSPAVTHSGGIMFIRRAPQEEARSQTPGSALAQIRVGGKFPWYLGPSPVPGRTSGQSRAMPRWNLVSEFSSPSTQTCPILAVYPFPVPMISRFFSEAPQPGAPKYDMAGRPGLPRGVGDWLRRMAPPWGCNAGMPWPQSSCQAVCPVVTPKPLARCAEPGNNFVGQ